MNRGNIPHFDLLAVWVVS